MSRLSEAQDRLEQALARLERASRERAEAGAGDAARDAEVELMRARCEALENKARIVSERLDTAIGRVRGLLEG